MRIEWTISSEDVAQVRQIVEQHWANPLVQDRVRRNLASEKAKITRSAFWRAMVASLLTTQQRSGPESKVSKFINTTPFPLAYELCFRESGAEKFRAIISKFGGIRRTRTIAAQLGANLQRLESGLWRETMDQLDRLRRLTTQKVEEEAANFIDDEFVGFGPKQSRNLLQGLGLTRHEIPIDSRIIKWLNRFAFPVVLSAPALADRNHYRFVLQSIQQLCARSDVYPCILDAAIFASFDGEGWTEENVGW